MAIDPTSLGLDGGVQPLIDTINPFLAKISIFVGGIFGLYLIYVIVRIYYERKRTKILEDIRYDLDQMNIHYNLPYSKHRLGIIKKIGSKLRDSINKSGGEEL